MSSFKHFFLTHTSCEMKITGSIGYSRKESQDFQKELFSQFLKW